MLFVKNKTIPYNFQQLLEIHQFEKVKKHGICHTGCGETNLKKKLFKSTFLLITLILCLNALEPTSATEYSNTNDITHTNNLEWTLSIDGLVDQTLNLSLNDIITLPQTKVNANLYCYGDLVSAGNWFGVELGVLLEKAGLNDEANYIMLVASDGYSTVLDVSIAMQQDVIIAYQLNGQPLPEILRLVLPKENGDKWISLITQITAISTSVSTSEKPNSQPTMFREAAKSLSPQSNSELTNLTNGPNIPFILSPKETDNSTTNQQISLNPDPIIKCTNPMLALILISLIICIGFEYSKHRKHRNLTIKH